MLYRAVINNALILTRFLMRIKIYDVCEIAWLPSQEDLYEFTVLFDDGVITFASFFTIYKFNI